MSDKINVRLILTDINVGSIAVRLKLKIKGQGLNIQSTDFVVGAAPITLTSGTPTILGTIDLQPYFRLNNLVGIPPQMYNRPLPEGRYEFCFEVHTTNTSNPHLVSSPTQGCAFAFLVVNDPPFLNKPQRGDQIVLKGPINIFFGWQSRSISATNVSYEFEIRELWDDQMDPQAAFLASPPLYTTTTRANAFLYNNTKPALLPDKTYAWRVRAISTTGIDENAVYRNNGYSEIFHFRLTKDCDAPKFPLSEATGQSTVKINWQGNFEHNKYHVQYRKVSYTQETEKQKQKREKKNKKRAKKGQKEKTYTPKKEDHHWFGVFTYNEQAQISNLEAGVTYEFRVGGTCTQLTEWTQYYSYTNENQFTMPIAAETVSYNCGVVPDIQITNQTPLQNIGVNETFKAGDFPVTIKEVQGSGGKFSGKGFIVVPYLADTKIAVAFKKISINTDYQLIDGMVQTTYDPTWGNMESVDDFIDGLGGLIDTIYDTLEDALEGLGILDGNYNEENIDFEIEDITVNENGETVIIGANGEEQNLGTGNNTVVTDENGNVIVVNEDGETGAISNEESARPNVSFKRLSDGLTGEKNIYGYDEVDVSNYDDDHISIENGKTTFCDIKFRGGSKIDDVFLQSEDSLSVKATFENNKVKIQSLYTGSKIEKKIYVKSKIDSSTVATITINSYKKISINGKIYSLFKQGDNSTKPPSNLNANSIKTATNEYLKYLVVNITTLNVDAEIPVDFDLNGNGKLDFFKNGTNIELDKVWDKLNDRKLGFNDIVRVKDYLNRMWVINASTIVDQEYIMVPGSATNKGFDLTKVDEYSIQSPTGGSKEIINIDSIVGNKVYLKSKLQYVHPKTTDPMTSHIITSKSKTAGLSAKDAKKKENQRPALTCGSITNSLMAIRISHELMHGKGLRDVNDSKNIMHYTISGQSIDNKKPYRFKELEPVITGTSTLDSSKPKQNQWNLINRK